MVHALDQIVSVNLKHHDSSLFSISSEFKSIKNIQKKILIYFIDSIFNVIYIVLKISVILWSRVLIWYRV